MIFRLVILNGPRKGERITVPIEPLTIGRGESCGLRLEDPEVATEHAVVEHHNGGLLVRDLGSMSRTLVNKREVQRAMVHHGDAIEIGRISLLVQAFVQAEISGGGPAGRVRRRRPLAVVLGLLAVAGAAVWLWTDRDGAPPPADPPPAVAAGEAQGPEPALTSVPPEIVVSVVTAAPPPAPIVTVTNREPDERTAEEIRRLREELATIKDTFRALATQQVRAAVQSPPPGVVPAPPAVRPSPPAPTRAQLSEQMMNTARSLKQAGKADDADAILARLQAEDAGHLPAYELRAAMYEQRGMPEKAMGQWALLLQRAAGTPQAERAAGEWARLTEEQRRKAPVTARKVRIRSLVAQRFPDSEDYDDMRLVHVTLESSGTPPPPSSVRVEVAFFDEDVGSGALTLTRGMPPRAEARVSGGWQADGTLGASAAYVVPAGLHASGRCRFHGYVVRVYAGGVLQDEAARPLDLLAQPAATARRSTP